MDTALDRHWTRREFEELAQFSLNGETSASRDNSRQITLLEVGCGVGNFLLPLLEDLEPPSSVAGSGNDTLVETKSSRLLFYACDISPRAVDMLRHHRLFSPSHCVAFVCDISEPSALARALLDLALQQPLELPGGGESFLDNAGNWNRKFEDGAVVPHSGSSDGDGEPDSSALTDSAEHLCSRHLPLPSTEYREVQFKAFTERTFEHLSLPPPAVTLIPTKLGQSQNGQLSPSYANDLKSKSKTPENSAAITVVSSKSLGLKQPLEGVFSAALVDGQNPESLSNMASIAGQPSSVAEALQHPVVQFRVASMIFVLSTIPPDKMLNALTNVTSCLLPGCGRLLFRDYALGDHSQLRFGRGARLRAEAAAYARQDGTLTYFFERNELICLLARAGLRVCQCDYVQRATVNRAKAVNVRRLFLQAVAERPTD